MGTDTSLGTNVGLPAPSVQVTAESSGVSYLHPAERETTVTATDADDLVRIWTAQRTNISRMRRHSSFTETKSGHHGSSEWAEFTIPAAEWNPASGAKRKSGMTDQQKAANAARLAAMREAKA